MQTRSTRVQRIAQLRSRMRTRVACVVFGLAVVYLVCSVVTDWHLIVSDSDSDTDASSVQIESPQLLLNEGIQAAFSRQVLSFTLSNCTPAAINQFPRDFIPQSVARRGAVAVHILVAAYMFVALALVCDDYFVPSLERICESLELQEDVAGATFMAAGSSAPEMATTVIGVFVAEDDIGLGAIVGSAVFNIMFVVSVCALAAHSVIYLNFWPLFRDSLYYGVSILALYVVIQDGHVYWYEGLLFIILYALYILLMYHNRSLERFVQSHSSSCLRVPEEWHEQVRQRASSSSSANATGNQASPANGNHYGSDLPAPAPASNASATTKFGPTSQTQADDSSSNTHDKNLLLLTGPTSKSETESPAATATATVPAVFGVAVNDRTLVGELGAGSSMLDSDSAKAAFVGGGANVDGSSSLSALQAANSEHELRASLRSANGHGCSYGDGGGSELEASGGNENEYCVMFASATSADCEDRLRLLPNAGSGSALASDPDPDSPCIAKSRKHGDRSRRWNGRRGFCFRFRCLCPFLYANRRVDADKEGTGSAKADADEHSPSSSKCTPCQVPDGCCKRFLWFVSLPISILLFITIPDCRQRRWRNWFWLSFLMSVLWIAVFSYLMVWMIAIIGYTFDIADSIMGITFIAAGASIPDMLASLIVVREGAGDMAISNAIGSNVFDILVCLGVPWLFQSVMSEYSETGIPVYSAGLLYSTLTLFVTVILFLSITWLNGWKMDLKYGVILMIIYIVFIALASLSELNFFGYVHPPTCFVSLP